jgi:hypothetical protein
MRNESGCSLNSLIKSILLINFESTNNHEARRGDFLLGDGKITISVVSITFESIKSPNVLFFIQFKVTSRNFALI